MILNNTPMVLLHFSTLEASFLLQYRVYFSIVFLNALLSHILLDVGANFDPLGCQEEPQIDEKMH